MKVFRLNEKAAIPQFATEGSACFDLGACLEGNITRIDPYNKRADVPVKFDRDGAFIRLNPAYTYLIPTGLVFSIPKRHLIEVYARSGLSVKKGLILANSVGIIDADYVEEVFVALKNTSDNNLVIRDGDRVAQARLVKRETYELEETTKKPGRTTRAGGFGSTGEGDLGSGKSDEGMNLDGDANLTVEAPQE